MARLRALLRRTVDPTDVELRVGSLALDPKKREATRSGTTLDLTKTEFEILHLLMRNPQIVLDRSTMYDLVWGYDFESSSRSLDVHVGYLRRKLEANGDPRMIETVRGIGFVLKPDEIDD